MKEPRVVVSDLAVADILAQADWYELQSDSKLATRWERAMTSSVLRLIRMPRSGQICGFTVQALQEVRRFPISGFRSHLIFYRFSLVTTKSTFLRVLHGARDLDRLLSG